jgi:tetratricopeptide (TPR) repeat protein
MLEGSILLRSSKIQEAREALDEALQIAYRGECVELQLECETNIGSWLLNKGFMDQAEDLIAISLRFAKSPNLVDDHSYIFSRSGIIIRLLQWQMLIAGARADYPNMFNLTMEALRVYKSLPHVDLWAANYVINNAANMVRDVDLNPALAEEVLQHVRALSDSPYLVECRFHTNRGVAYSKAATGDILGAFGLFRESSKFEVSLPLRAYAAIDTSLIARALGQTKKADRELELALDYAGRVDWEANDTDARCALLLLARAAAPTMPKIARRTMERYKTIKRRIGAEHCARYDPRLTAELAMTEGVVAKAEGRDGYAEEHLARAFAFWHSTRIFKRSAVEAALELAEITADPQLLAYADAWLADRPLSYVASIAARVRREIVRRQR